MLGWMHASGMVVRSAYRHIRIRYLLQLQQQQEKNWNTESVVAFVARQSQSISGMTRETVNGPATALEYLYLFRKLHSMRVILNTLAGDAARC